MPTPFVIDHPAVPMLFYRASDGLAKTGVVGSDGGVTRLLDVGGFLTGWTHIANAGGGQVLLYRASDGFAATGLVTSNGDFTNMWVVHVFATGWSQIVNT